MGFSLPSRLHIARPRWIGMQGDEEAAVSPAAAWHCDLTDDDALTWDAGVFDLFGIARGQRIDRREIVQMYDAPSRALLERLRSAAIASSGSFTFEARIRRMDGDWRWMRVTADTIARGGRAVQLYGTKQDVTAEMMAD